MSYKKIIYLLLSLTLILITLNYFFIEKNRDPNQPAEHSSQEDPDHAEEDDSSPITSVKEVVSAAEEGKVPNIPITVGLTKMDDITDKWGKPDNSVQAEAGIYEDFSKYSTTVGFKDNVIFDVRSFDPALQQIRLNDIKEVSGNPDATKYYKDASHDQVIFIFDVNSLYQLKWILPKPSTENKNPKVDHISVISLEKVDTGESDILSTMSLDEKIGQMIIAGVNGTQDGENTKTLIQEHKVGGFIFFSDNLSGPRQTVQFLNYMKKDNVNNPLPLLLSVDQEGGKVTRLPGGLVNFPTNKKIGALNDPDVSFEVGTILGKELKEYGFNLDFAPVLDVNSNPNNPVIGDRSFSDHPDIVSELGIQTMRGIQSEGILSTIKHFPGHGDTSVDSHLELPVVNKSIQELESLELIPFKEAINNGADLVMVAHILLPKIDDTYPSSLSKNVITDLLRKKLNYNGVVITDDMTMKAITNNYGMGQATVQSVKAGSDLILIAHDYNKALAAIDALKKAVQNGEISEGRIDASVSRIIELKQAYKLEDIQTGEVDLKQLNQSIESIKKKIEQ
ncbi:beta-N-acetylhexosaminidase [Bacillus sp. CH30_1T]|uniref:beta-N-acetylhexosaminidase n=1 Tax=Bacillus sp. CH30_1T TaxID=2604836 RepID=UPI0011F04FF0|nr:beta-N-acetylhexosaminidase [Bacillus sp. CH30_1T]KAA0561802.1 beta-N-acetylhexosaminidase [Bacillus sp. CH30_1T]